nr:GntR family transcriptional regulator [Desulfobotulus pelophilus]
MKSLIAYDKIKELILSGRKYPGTRLVLAELETELGIGRGPIREALMRLDRSGLVRNVPYKGAIVAPLPKKNEMDYIFSIRVKLEAELAKAAMKNLRDEDMEELEKTYQKMQCMTQEFYSLDRHFHDVLYEASDYPHLCLIAHKLVESVEAFLNLFQHDENDYRIFLEEHALILEFLKKGDSEKLQKAVADNVKSGMRRIEKAYALLMNNHG